jgi:hypothetical protein
MNITTVDLLKQHCLQNKYSKWYFNIIDSAMVRGWERSTSPCYVEGHHVVPRSISGDSMKSGVIVFLTAREHFVCHLLLPKMLEGKDKNKMQLALHRLMTGNKKNYCKSSYLYELIRISSAEAASVRSKSYWSTIPFEERSIMRSGENNSRWGAVVNEETREKIRNANKGKLAKEKHPLWNVGHSLETKKKMSDDRKGCLQPRRWFNDGVKQYYVLPENAESNWVHGRISHLNPMYGKVGASQGKKWFNDPVNRIEKYFTPGQQPEGYIQGRLK